MNKHAIGALLAIGGTLALALLIREVGTTQLIAALAAGASVVPLLVLLEISGMALDALVIRSLHGTRGSEVDTRTWIRSSLLATFAAQTLPGGRVLGEVLRASLIAPRLAHGASAPLVRAGSVALVGHGLHVLVVALMASVAAVTLDGPLRWALAAVAAWTSVLGLALSCAPRSLPLLRWLARRLQLTQLADVSSLEPIDGLPRALGLSVLSRLAHLTAAGIAVHAVLATPTPITGALVSESLQLLAANVGDAVPGQAGVFEGTFRLFSGPLYPFASPAVAANAAVAVALLLRATRIGVAAIAGVAYWLAPKRSLRTALAMSCLLVPSVTSAQSEAPRRPVSGRASLGFAIRSLHPMTRPTPPDVPGPPEMRPIPRMLAASALVLPPVLLIAFEPDGTRHPMMHQLRSLLAVWLYTVGVVVVIHAVTELSARVMAKRWSAQVHQSLGVILALLAVLVLSIPIAPVLASVCPGIAGHETDLVLRGTMLGAIYAVVGLALGHSQRAFVESRLTVERAQRAEAEARLAAVTARTQPHFLANALNTIAASVREDPARAEDLIERLGGLFSHALGAAGQTEVALLDELSAAKSYLVVQAARFGDRLTFEVEVADALTGDEAQRVPVMSIVPLVENAVLHGLSVPGIQLQVRLAITTRGSEVLIEVRDDGPGPEGSQHHGHGTALRELNERLGLVHGEGNASASVVREDAQTIARLRVPRSGGSQ